MKLENYFKENMFFKNLLRDTDSETLFHTFKIMDL